MIKAADSCDVGIIGGGLAGLTLALQLRRQHPDFDIAVLERNRHPVPLAAHKVGESTVEMGAHYLSHHVGIRDHLEKDHLRKFGLRFFFGAGPGGLETADELGTSKLLSTPSYQVDRGVLENELGRRAAAAGIRFMDASRVHGVEMNGSKKILYSCSDQKHDQATHSLESRWLVDAASRASPTKRHLGLGEPNDHDVNAAWFRVEGELRIDAWSDDRAWQDRCDGQPRWLSTNHLMGAGYWIWLIPLSSGATSIGIVADPRLHPLETYKTPGLAMQWLARNAPRCAEALSEAKIMDFSFLRHFSHGSGQLFSDQRWALTGEAGVFLDPFYSPGTDFIGISNGFITDLIGRDQAGENISARARMLELSYRSYYGNTLSLYQDLYPGFGDCSLMVLKTTWDYSYYWGILALMYFNDALQNVMIDPALTPIMMRAAALNRRMQSQFRDRAVQARSGTGRGLFIDQYQIPLMRRLNRQLTDDIPAEDFSIRLSANTDELEQLAHCLGLRLEDPRTAVNGWERNALGDLPERCLG
ncbi:MAG TPA: FAD-dependent monooxygenase [Xanthomonadales bacterium]|nr:FAD-dependent monooxygenase [Xanthomonadales bacterium]